MILSTLLLTSWLAVQDPPKPPAEPPRAGDAARDQVKDAKGAAQVDVELRAALEELRRANGYKIEIDGTMYGGEKKPVADVADPKLPDPNKDEQGDKGEKGEEKVAKAKEATAKRESFRGTGSFEREKPVQLKSDKLEAFRSNRKLVWRTREQKEWQMVPASIGEPPKAAAGNDDARLAALLAGLPLPDDLIRDFDARLVSCQRSPGADVKGGMATYDCILGPGADARGAGKSDGKNCSLRLTVAQGRIAAIDWRHPAEKAASIPQPPSGAAGGASITCHYQLSDFGGTQVTVPEDAARILADR